MAVQVVSAFKDLAAQSGAWLPADLLQFWCVGGEAGSAYAKVGHQCPAAGNRESMRGGVGIHNGHSADPDGVSPGGEPERVNGDHG
jgi:hypothetical protein